ncbi:MAG: cytochrome c biogenesis protein CcsA [Bacteroidaceae bacterium]|nr:cytochrome c biogenesis protein CcsA [Bacteroidaceae bacterium]
MNRHLLRSISFVTLLLLAMLLIAATFMEKYYGTAITTSHVYHSPLFIATWAVLALSAMAYIACVSRQATLIMLHVSLVIVLLGAFTSFMTSKRGELQLSRNAVPASMFTTADGDLEKLQFRITLEQIEIHRIESEVTDYHAQIAVQDDEHEHIMRVSLNSPVTIDGHSLCIKSVSDGHVSLMVSYDPWGEPISYMGYVMTLASFIALLFDRKSQWKSLLKRLGRKERKKKNNYTISKIRRSAAIVFALTILGIIRWYNTGLFPVTNGKESMLFFIWISLLLAIVATYRKELKSIAATFFTLGGIALFAMLPTWDSDGGEIAPILRTPLLSIHVTTIITAYVLLGCTAMNASIALFLGVARHNSEKMEKMAVTGRILLYPATLLLMTGIFIGAVWANISWGRYWGWDPKEVWALITLIICSIAFHARSLPFMGKAVNFHIFCLVAFLAMLFTFFGVNYLFGGLHSYM